MDRPLLRDVLAHRDVVLRAFVGADGRLASIPTKVTTRLVILEHLAQGFTLGERYPESEVNGILRRSYDDVAALRRYLVDERFLERRDGVYWRAGSTPT